MEKRPMQEYYTFHTDPGHGWLEVEFAELERLGIAGEISHYSYRNGSIAYLEEDGDAARFANAKAAAGEEFADHTVNVNHSHKIRSYRPYTVPEPKLGRTPFPAHCAASGDWIGPSDADPGM
jgi:hypothetical protein